MKLLNGIILALFMSIPFAAFADDDYDKNSDTQAVQVQADAAAPAVTNDMNLTDGASDARFWGGRGGWGGRGWNRGWGGGWNRGWGWGGGWNNWWWPSYGTWYYPSTWGGAWYW